MHAAGAPVTDLNKYRAPGNIQGDKPPDGWKPRLEVDDTDGGYIISKPYEPHQHPDYANILTEFGLDPQLWQIRSVRRSRWQTYDERWLEAARISIVPAGQTVDRVDAERLVEGIAKWKPRTSDKVNHDGCYVQPVGDSQVGKSDGDGTSGTVDRFLRYTEASVVKLRHTVRKGRTSHVALPWAGDCIEGIWSQGGALRSRLDLSVTEQVRVLRRLMWAQLSAFAPYAEQLTIPVVPGNHDEAVRTGNQMSSTYDDSWAVDAASAVADMVAENDDLKDRVRFIFPRHDELTVTFDADGTSTGVAHGHQFGSDPLRWWDEQAGGRNPIGQTDVLIGAHLHHLRIQDHGGEKLFIQIPALDGGSQWFKHRRGQRSPSRMVSWWTRDGRVWGLDPLVT